MCLFRCAYFLTSPPRRSRALDAAEPGSCLRSGRDELWIPGGPLAKATASLTCPVQGTAASVIPSLEVRPEDSGSSGSLAPIPVGCRLPSALGEEGRDTGCEHAWGERWGIGEDLGSIRGTSEDAEPSGRKAGNSSHPGMCREPDHQHVHFPRPEDSGSWDQRGQNHTCNMFEVLSPNVPLIHITDLACVHSTLPLCCPLAHSVLPDSTLVWPAPLPSTPQGCAHCHTSQAHSCAHSRVRPGSPGPDTPLSWPLRNHPVLIFLQCLCLPLPSSLLVLPDVQMHTLLSGRGSACPHSLPRPMFHTR